MLQKSHYKYFRQTRNKHIEAAVDCYFEKNTTEKLPSLDYLKTIQP